MALDDHYSMHKQPLRYGHLAILDVPLVSTKEGLHYIYKQHYSYMYLEYSNKKF